MDRHENMDLGALWGCVRGAYVFCGAPSRARRVRGGALRKTYVFPQMYTFRRAYVFEKVCIFLKRVYMFSEKVCVFFWKHIFSSWGPFSYTVHWAF